MNNVKKYWIKWCFGICLFSLLCSCNTDKGKKIMKEISLLQSKPVVYYQNKFVQDGMLQERLKYIVYSDSVNCSSCAINQMELWNPLLEYSKNYKGQLNFYFIFSPAEKDIKGVKHALIKNSEFDYPIFLDTLGMFEKLNPHLPKNKALHAFLLDDNNNVVLVGNLLHSKKVKELFYKIVEEKLGKPQALPIRDSIN